MVKIGFVVEGDSEKVIVESAAFQSLLHSKGYKLVLAVDAKGGGNLLPQNIDKYLQAVKNAGAEHIFVLTDRENEASSEIIRQRIAHTEIDYIAVAVKALEAWFLADTKAMQSWLDDTTFFETNPEQTPEMPWDRIKQIAKEKHRQGPGSKTVFAKKISKKYGFDISNAAQHDNCPSANELLIALNNLNSG